MRLRVPRPAPRRAAPRSGGPRRAHRGGAAAAGRPPGGDGVRGGDGGAGRCGHPGRTPANMQCVQLRRLFFENLPVGGFVAQLDPRGAVLTHLFCFSDKGGEAGFFSDSHFFVFPFSELAFFRAVSLR